MFGKITLATVFITASSMAVLLWGMGTSAEQSAPVTKTLKVDAFETEEVSAKSFVVYDIETGNILAAQNENEPYPIASVTKLFSAAIAVTQTELERMTTVTDTDVAAEGRAGKLEAGVEYTYRDLLWPLLLESSNDAAAVLERNEAELLARMNDYVVAVGANNTNFADASGLSSDNISTAAELAVLTGQLYQEVPSVFDITQLPQYIGTQTGWVNNNPFIADAAYRGGKHGYTEAANRTASALFEEHLASGDTRLIGYVVLGSDDLASDVTELRAEVAKKVGLQ